MNLFRKAENIVKSISRDFGRVKRKILNDFEQKPTLSNYIGNQKYFTV